MRWLVVLALAACGERDAPPAPARPEPVAPRAPAPPPPPTVADKPSGPASPQCELAGAHVCLGDDVRECGTDGQLGRRIQTCKGGCKAGKCTATCAAEGVELIYLVDSNARLASFDPRKLPRDPFREIGTLACNPASTPYSMTVDRDGLAWVLYADGTLFRVSILDAHCTPVRIDRSIMPAVYGMGYVSDGPRATTERLYIADDASLLLGELDIRQTPVTFRPVQRITTTSKFGPELTGTGAGKLFGYFVDPRAFVQQIDRRTGKLVGTPMQLDHAEDDVTAYAFAHWGGVFYMFTSLATGSAAVEVLDPRTRRARPVWTAQRKVMGAGVSTCAPQLEAPP